LRKADDGRKKVEIQKLGDTRENESPIANDSPPINVVNVKPFTIYAPLLADGLFILWLRQSPPLSLQITSFASFALFFTHRRRQGRIHRLSRHTCSTSLPRTTSATPLSSREPWAPSSRRIIWTAAWTRSPFIGLYNPDITNGTSDSWNQ
jgi:hypothetical protein